MRWKSNAELAVRASIRQFLNDEIIPQLKSKKDRMLIGSNAKLNAIERELRFILAIDEGKFDADPWLFNTMAGTWELHGVDQPFKLREHRRDDYITKLAPFTPGGECPLWLNFLEFITNGDKDLARYLQKLCGYALIGDRSEQMFAFLYGGGNNGKSVFLQTLLYVLGDYAVTVPSEVFMWSPFPRHPEELMTMKGARLIVSSEVPADCKWNITRLKQVTGGERIRAAYKHKDSVEFNVTGLLVMAGNDKPQIKSIDLAIKRRIHLVPFTATISEDFRDKRLAAKLQTEAGAILAWMIEGCRLWQLEGLDRPPAVAIATNQYILEEDDIRQWADECTEDNVHARTRSGQLYASWKQWADASGLNPGSIKTFSSNLKKMGFETAHSRDGTLFLRVALRAVTGDRW